MEITVPMSSKQKDLDAEARQVLYKAADVAEYRQVKFTYPVVRNKLYTTNELCWRVEEISNNTVKRAYISNGYITFNIKTV